MGSRGASRVRFAVVGCGSLAQGTHLPNLVRNEKAELAVCCDTSEQTLEVCQRRFGPGRLSRSWQEVVADPEVDAICLATTEKLRLPVIAAAAKAGKAVYVEKPLARTLDEVYAIQSAVRESGIPFCVGHNRRSSPAMVDAHAMFRGHMEAPQPCPWRWNREGGARPDLPEEGRASMSVRVNDDWHSWKAWVFDPQQAPHGPLLFEMTHFTDMCNWFLAAEPEEVFAAESGMLNHAIIVRYRTGELATITMCANGTFGYPKELYEMMGQGGIVVVDHMVEVRTAGIEGAPHQVNYPLSDDPFPGIGQEGGLHGWLAKRREGCRQAVETGDPTRSLQGGPDKGHARHLDRFIDEIRGEGPVVCGVDEAVLATRVAFAAVRSAAERRPVAVADL